METNSSNTLIKDRKTIENFFEQDSFDCLFNGEQKFCDFAILEYYAKNKDLGEPIDSSGADYYVRKLENDGEIVVDVMFDKVDFEKKSEEQKIFQTRGMVFNNNGENVYHLYSVKEMPSDYFFE